MKRHYIPILSLLLLLILALGALAESVREGSRLASNQRSLVAQNQALRSEVVAQEQSVARLRMTVGELEEFRRADAERIRELGIKLRHARALTLTESIQRLDTIVVADLRPLLSDSLYRLQLRDGWVSLDVEVRPREAHISLTSCDTLFQVVHRVPWRWWIFSWGTKAIRQEIRSSNPHSRLVYSEYIEIEN
ncbi:MAG: hypothetical protein IKY63_00170 [Tidjanibacter sp.]|nr:hypothetical protein [Tidjanibacter sp.]